MRYQLKKVTKPMMYTIIQTYTDLELPALADCYFNESCYRTGWWFELPGYRVFLDVCMGEVYIRVRGTAYDHIITIPFEWLREHEMLQEVA